MESKKVDYSKLVRDRIPEIMLSEGDIPCYFYLSDKDYINELKRKLKEEVEEYVKNDNIEELADILEVLYALLEVSGYTFTELEATRKLKAKKKGSFTKRIFLDCVYEGDKKHEQNKEDY